MSERPWRNPQIKSAMHNRVTATLCKGLRTRFGGRKLWVGLSLGQIKIAASDNRRANKRHSKKAAQIAA